MTRLWLFLVPVSSTTAHASCACITARPSTAPATLTHNSHTFSAGYGLRNCQAWDNAETPACNETSAPSWCALEWCYVGPDCAGMPDVWSVEQDGGIPDPWFPASGLSRSYATCKSSTYISRMASTRASTMSADDILAYTESFLRSLRKTVENVDANLANAYITGGDRVCPQIDSCNCDSCVQSWTNTSKVNVEAVGVTAENFTKVAEDIKGDACIEYGAITGKFKSLTQDVYDDPSRIGEASFTWQDRFGEGGGKIRYPAQDTCPEQRDYRLVPEYSFSVSGAKDVVIVIDNSNDMRTKDVPGVGEVNFRNRALEGLKRILDTLHVNDRVGVVYAGSIHEEKDTDHPDWKNGAVPYERNATGDSRKVVAYLHAPTEERKKDIVKWVEERFKKASGHGHCLINGLNQAMKLLRDSKLPEIRRSSYCVTAAVVLSGGNDDLKSNEYINAIKDLQPAPTLFWYDWGATSASHQVAKEMACAKNSYYQYNGVYFTVGAGDDIGAYLEKYFFFYAAGAMNVSQVRYTFRKHETTGADVVRACLPAYTPWLIHYRKIIGVGCVDLNLILDIDTLKARDGGAVWNDLVGKIETSNKVCQKTFAPESTMEWNRYLLCAWEWPWWGTGLLAFMGSVMITVIMGCCYVRRDDLREAMRIRGQNLSDFAQIRRDAEATGSRAVMGRPSEQGKADIVGRPSAIGVNVGKAP